MAEETIEKKCSSLASFLYEQQSKQDKKTWLLFPNPKMKKKSFELLVEAASLCRDNPYTVNVYAFIDGVQWIVLKVFVLQPNKSTGGLSLVGIVQSPL